jgi:membrane fusion protein (multidrug efflux system)
VLAQFSVAQSKATPVIVTVVEHKAIVDEVEALGTLRANESVDLTATVTELVTVINFKDGERVKKGEVLVEMDTSEEVAEYAEEQSRLNEARRQVKRLEPLTKKGAASQSILDERQREFETAKARMQAIQSRIDERRIVAPFDGVVGLRNISVGALVQPGTMITTIDDDSVMKLDFSVPSVFLSTIAPGIDIEARAHAFRDKVFEGTIASVDSRIDPVTRSIKVRAILENPDRILKPGLLMSVVLEKDPREALVVPEEAMILESNKFFVLVVVENQETTTVEMREIKIGQRRRGEVEVLSGLNDGELIVIHGTTRARPGMPVEVKIAESGDEKLTELLNQNGADIKESKE